MSGRKWISKTDGLKKLERYCAYQDRCHQEVRSKGLDIGLYGDELEEVIATLIENNFLNEERFARSFARGKFRMKKWGRVRIRQELKMRKISAYCIRKGLEEIEEDQYLKTLDEIIGKRSERHPGIPAYQQRKKVVDYLLRRGYEVALSWERAKVLIPEN
jgi:regulatory protein